MGSGVGPIASAISAELSDVVITYPLCGEGQLQVLLHELRPLRGREASDIDDELDAEALEQLHEVVKLAVPIADREYLRHARARTNSVLG